MNRLNELKDSKLFWDRKIEEWSGQGIKVFDQDMIHKAREDYWILRGMTCAIRYQRNVV